MKKKLSYRDKLLELAYIYNVKEIQEYVKNKKNLTSGQLELILKKNNIDEKKLLKCVENCKFSNLKMMEKEKGFDESMVNKKTGNKITFFNLGENYNFKDILEKDLINEMNDYFKYQLKKYKYII